MTLPLPMTSPLRRRWGLHHLLPSQWTASAATVTACLALCRPLQPTARPLQVAESRGGPPPLPAPHASASLKKETANCPSFASNDAPADDSTEVSALAQWHLRCLMREAQLQYSPPHHYRSSGSNTTTTPGGRALAPSSFVANLFGSSRREAASNSNDDVSEAGNREAMNPITIIASSFALLHLLRFYPKYFEQAQVDGDALQELYHVVLAMRHCHEAAGGSSATAAADGGLSALMRNGQMPTFSSAALAEVRMMHDDGISSHCVLLDAVLVVSSFIGYQIASSRLHQEEWMIPCSPPHQTIAPLRRWMHALQSTVTLSWQLYQTRQAMRQRSGSPAAGAAAHYRPLLPDSQLALGLCLLSCIWQLLHYISPPAEAAPASPLSEATHSTAPLPAAPSATHGKAGTGAPPSPPAATPEPPLLLLLQSIYTAATIADAALHDYPSGPPAVLCDVLSVLASEQRWGGGRLDGTAAATAWSLLRRSGYWDCLRLGSIEVISCIWSNTSPSSTSGRRSAKHHAIKAAVSPPLSESSTTPTPASLRQNLIGFLPCARDPLEAVELPPQLRTRRVDSLNVDDDVTLEHPERMVSLATPSLLELILHEAHSFREKSVLPDTQQQPNDDYGTGGAELLQPSAAPYRWWAMELQQAWVEVLAALIA